MKKFLENLSDFFGKYMAIIVLIVAGVSLFAPSSAMWIEMSSIGYLLAIIMFGMGLTLRLDDFKLVFTHPKDIFLGASSQFIIMPLLAFGLGIIFDLDAALMTGVILVGACPGGTSSNVITYLSKGDVALSVSITSVNTLLAPFLTPLIVYLFLHTSVNVDIFAMFISIVKVVLAPIIFGFVINKYFENFTRHFIKILPMISVLAICAIVASVVAHNSQKILNTGFVILAVVILHNVLGYFCGFWLGKMCGLSVPKTKALSIEIGMQNSGLATSLAASSFGYLAMASVPGAIFSVWHNISGAILANIFRRWEF